MCIHEKQQGVALITVMLIVASATILAVAMLEQQALGLKKAAYAKHAGQSYFYAIGVERWAVGRLRRDLHDEPAAKAIDHLQEDWARKFNLQLADRQTRVSGQIDDLNARFNINNLLRQRSGHTAANKKTGDSVKQKKPAARPPAAGSTSKPPANTDYQQFKRLLASLQIPPHLGNAVLDWIDSDSLQRFPGGAEKLVYRSKTRPYGIADNYLSSITELKLVNGMTDEFYAKLAPYVTALPPGTKINVNTASARVIASLSPQFNSTVVAGLLNRRQRQPFKSTAGFLRYARQLSGQKKLLPADLQDRIAVSSNYFASRARIRMRQSRLTLISLIRTDRIRKTAKVIRRGRGAL